jgi:flagellar biogenesis protein FliO
MLLPFYSVNIDTIRDFSGHIAAIAFIVFLFWHLNMHYMNIFWALKGYRVYTLSPNETGNPLSGRSQVVLITKRSHIVQGEKIQAHRLSKTVYLEEA